MDSTQTTDSSRHEENDTTETRQSTHVTTPGAPNQNTTGDNTPDTHQIIPPERPVTHISPEDTRDTQFAHESTSDTSSPSTGSKILNAVRTWVLRLIGLIILLLALFSVLVKYHALPPMWWDSVNSTLVSVIDNTENWLTLERPDQKPLSPQPDATRHHTQKQNEQLQHDIDDVASEVERQSQLEDLKMKRATITSLLHDIEQQERELSRNGAPVK